MPPIWIPCFERTIEDLKHLERRGAERRVAEALNKISSSDVWILHSLRYVRPKETGAPTNLEIDFLVVWKNRGFLIMEVKGGRIEYDATENTWWCGTDKSRKRYGRSPVAQVMGQMNDLCNYILPEFIPERLKARKMVERVLVFPDVSLSAFKDECGQRAHRINDFEIESIVDREQMESLASFVEQKLECCAKYVQQSNISGKMFEDVVRRLRPSVHAEVLPQHILEQADSQIEEATNEQKEHLGHVLGARRLLMSGPAGSGKTVLGLSAVLSWAENGVAAYYIAESKYLISGLRSDPRYFRVKERILTIHDFMEMTLNTKIEDRSDAIVAALYDWEFLAKGFCVVIDEAQDLRPDLYEALVSLLPCERLWVLRDSRQSLNRDNDDRNFETGTMVGATPYDIKKNCRNARPIAEHIAKYVSLPPDYVNDLLPQSDRPPEKVIVTTMEEQNQKLLEILRRAETDGWTKDKYVVLSCASGGRSAVQEKYCSNETISSFRGLFSYAGEDGGKVAIYHFLDFRGLESPFAIVTDIEDQESVFRANYLAGSRAKYRLVLIHRGEPLTTVIPPGLRFD